MNRVSYLLTMGARVGWSKVGRLIFEICAASMCGYLAWLAASFALEQLPRLLISGTTSVRIAGFDPSLASPGWRTRFPDRPGRSLFSLYLLSVPLWGMILLPLGLTLARRLRGWSGLFAVQAILIVAWRVGIYGILIGTAGWFHPWYPAPFNTAGGTLSTALRLLLGAALAGEALFLVYRTSRSLLGSLGGGRAECLAAVIRWVLVPLMLVALFITRPVVHAAGLPSWMPVATGLVFLIVFTLPAAYPAGVAGVPFRPGPAGGAVVMASFAVVVASLIGYGAWQESRRRNEYQSEFSIFRSEYWTLRIQKTLLSEKSRETWGKEQDDNLRAATARLGITRPASTLNLFLYRSATLKRAMTGSDTPFTVLSEKDELHLLADPAEDPRGTALLLMQEAWNKPACEAVAQAVARFAAGSFLGNSLREYGARIVREEGAYSLREVLALDERFASPILRDVLGGLWVQQLVERHGAAILKRIYREPLSVGKEDIFARAVGAGWADLEAEWLVYQTDLMQIALRRDDPLSKEPFYQRGMTLTQRGYGTGYGSDRATEQLDHLRGQGVNTITLVPYAATRAPTETSISILEDSRDDRVIRTLQQAHGAGLHCVLKPQLSSGDEFVGNITFKDEVGFRVWFENYRRWMLHYARIAELYRADCLVVGTELAGLTRHEASWRALIRDVRSVYSGSLTYAAHWGPDFEGLPFWDALDYIGLNMYYPLTDPGEEPRPDSPRLLELVRMFEKVARRFGKRIVFTEVGFPNTASAAAEPYRKTNRPVDLGLQARCARTVLEAFGHQKWFGGMNWWEWPTTGQSGSFYETYILSGNPAADIVTGWYSAMREP